MGNRAEVGEIFVRALTRVNAGGPPEELAKAIERGFAEAMQVSVPILAGHCEVAQKRSGRGSAFRATSVKNWGSYMSAGTDMVCRGD
jgi:hypothetical protein